MIDIADLVVEYGDTRVLDEISLSVSSGSVTGLVGPNGAGKTTLLRAINDYITPTKGTVRIDGAPIETLSAADVGRHVATVPQENSLRFAFDVETVVSMGRYPHVDRLGTPTAADQQAIERALERTETTQFRDRQITELSGGQRRRVLVARALAQATPVILFDEPTASLDINHQIKLLSLITGLADDGHTVLTAIHDLELAARFCDQIVLLSDGVIAARGQPSTVLTAETIQETFGIEVAIGTNSATDTPTITPLPADHADSTG